MAKIVIIGAGLTGLSAAYHLEKKKFYDYKIFEKEDTVGGLCRSVEQDGFTFDFTGHLLHISDPYFKEFLHEIIGLEKLTAINRRSFIFSHQVYTRYPYQINLYGLPTQVIAECIEGFATRKKTRKQPKTYPEWVRTHFGSGFAKHFFFPFQRKLFAYNLNEITPSWTGRFVPRTSLNQMIDGALRDTYDPTIGYNANFLYPRSGGIQLLPSALEQKIKQSIYTGHCLLSIDIKNKRVHFANGHSEPFDQLITTVPLPRLLTSIQDKPSTKLSSAAHQLHSNSVANFNLGIARENVSEKHWIYFPEKEFPFYRIGFPHNFTASMTPAGCSSLYGECAYVNKSPAYVNRMLKHAITKAQDVLNIKNNEIITQKIIHIPHAYALYTHWREKHLTKLLDRLQEHDIYSIGRYGAWKYSSMQEAVLDGKQIAHTLTILPAKHTFYIPKVENIKKETTA